MIASGGEAAEDYRLAGLHLCAGEEELRAEGVEDLFDEIVFAHGDSTGEQHEVAAADLEDGLFELGAAVGCDGQALGFAACVCRESGEGVAVGVADLPGV